MHIACVEWGFCGCVKYDQPVHVDMFIPSYGPVTANQFVEWLFLADDQNPNVDPERWLMHKEALRTAFVNCMGAEVVDASELRWARVKDAPSNG